MAKYIISFDVGITHMSWCAMDLTPIDDEGHFLFEIRDWAIVNLRTGVIQRNPRKCVKCSKYAIDITPERLPTEFCKRHYKGDSKVIWASGSEVVPVWPQTQDQRLPLIRVLVHVLSLGPAYGDKASTIILIEDQQKFSKAVTCLADAIATYYVIRGIEDIRYCAARVKDGVYTGGGDDLGIYSGRKEKMVAICNWLLSGKCDKFQPIGETTVWQEGIWDMVEDGRRHDLADSMLQCLSYESKNQANS